MSTHYSRHEAVDEKQVAKRATAAVVGAFVADSASLGLHWIYDQSKIKEIGKKEGRLAFLEPRYAQWHVKKQVGDSTMYGETVAVLLRSLGQVKGVSPFSASTFLGHYNDCFGVGGSYIGYADKLSKTIVRSLLQLSDAQSVAMGPLTPLSDHKLRGAAYSNLKKIVESTPREELTSTVDDMIRGASPSASAADSAVVHSVATKLAANIDAWTGIVSDEPGVLALVVPLVARLAGHPEMLHEVTRAARTLQSSDDSDVWVPFVARVLEAAILGVPLQDAVSTNLPRLPQPQRASVESAVNAGVEEALAASRAGTAGGEAMGDESLATAQRLGLACPLGQTIPTAIYLALRRGPDALFEDVINDNIAAGGDSCGRALLVGSLLGAALAEVPEDMVGKTSPGLREEVVKLTVGIHTPVHGESHSDHVAVLHSS